MSLSALFNVKKHLLSPDIHTYPHEECLLGRDIQEQNLFFDWQLQIMKPDALKRSHGNTQVMFTLLWENNAADYLSSVKQISGMTSPPVRCNKL